jgi:ketosteroid isomerase-like protein
MPLSLQEMSDRFEIQDLITDYADAIDQCDIDRLDTIFSADAFIDYTAVGGEKGDLAQIKKFLKASLPLFKNSQHLISNFQFRISGDTATGKVMCFNPMQLDSEKQGHPVMFLGLWYHDEYVRTTEGWRISQRVEQKSYHFNTPRSVNAGQ